MSKVLDKETLTCPVGNWALGWHDIPVKRKLLKNIAIRWCLGQWLEIKKFSIHDIALLVPRKRWTDDVEEDEKIMGIRHWHTGPETRRNWGRLPWKPRYTTWSYCLRRNRRKRRRRGKNNGGRGGGRRKRRRRWTWRQQQLLVRIVWFILLFYTLLF
jgi:hypothetical protein